jgi:hypothetical protein
MSSSNLVEGMKADEIG